MKRLAIHNPFNAPVYHEETVTSTMDISRALAAKGEPHGTVIAADFQEAGRGRVRERPWDMDRRTSLPFTILLRYPRIESIPVALTLRTGLAVALAIEDFVPALAGVAPDTGAVLVKWPNDIMIRTPADSTAQTAGAAQTAPKPQTAQKAAGILTEAHGGGTVFIGIGINVAQKEFPAFLRDKATSISLASGIDIAPEARFALLEKILARLYSELETATDWRNRLEERLYKKGEQVCFTEGAAGSDRIVEGRLAGIGAGGELLIVPQGESEPRAFITGELRVY